MYVCTYYYDNEVNHFFLEDLLHSLLVCVCVWCVRKFWFIILLVCVCVCVILRGVDPDMSISTFQYVTNFIVCVIV